MLTESQKAKFEEYKSEKDKNCKARERLELLFGGESYSVYESGVRNGEDYSGVITAYGYIYGNPVYVFAQDSDVNGGAMNKNHAAKICKLYELASRTGVPVIGIYDSNGAFIGDGAEAIKAYSDILTCSSNLSGVVPQYSVILGTCTGSAAMVACSADIVVVTENAEVYATVGKEMNGKDVAKNGTAAICAEDDNAAIKVVKELISKLPSNNLSECPVFEYNDPAEKFENTASGIVNAVFDCESSVELSAEFGKASYTAFCNIKGYTVGLAATNKTADKLTSDDCTKLSRFMRTCDAFSVPIVTIIDTEGFDADVCVRDMAKLASVYGEATTLKISVVTGKAYGAAMAALGAGNADYTITYPDAVIFPIAPETAVEFMWHDKLKGAADLAAERSKLAAQYAEENASAFDAAAKNCVDDIILPENTRDKIFELVDIMGGKRMMKRMPKKHSNMPF